MKTRAGLPSSVAAFVLVLLIGLARTRSDGCTPPTPEGARRLESVLDLNVTARATATHGHWHLPGVRNLDPRVFGTVAEPLGFEFMLGVPLYDRLDDGMGNWTTTALPGPDSNVTLPIGHHSVVELNVRDRTPVDQATYASVTYDEVTLRCVIHDPFGREIEIVADQPLPKGPFHQFFGGVGTNLVVHGRTGLGSKGIPECFAYVSLYALGEVRIDGQLLPGNDRRLVHAMVVHGVQDHHNHPGPAGGPGPFLGTDAEVDQNDLEVHVHLPPVRFTPEPVANAPVYGVGQDFIHVMFEDVTLIGSTINGTLIR